MVVYDQNRVEMAFQRKQGRPSPAYTSLQLPLSPLLLQDPKLLLIMDLHSK